MATVHAQAPDDLDLLATLLMSSAGTNAVPLIIVAVVVAYVATAWLPQTPEELTRKSAFHIAEVRWRAVPSHNHSKPNGGIF